MSAVAQEDDDYREGQSDGEVDEPGSDSASSSSSSGGSSGSSEEEGASSGSAEEEEEGQGDAFSQEVATEPGARLGPFCRVGALCCSPLLSAMRCCET